MASLDWPNHPPMFVCHSPAVGVLMSSGCVTHSGCGRVVTAPLMLDLGGPIGRRDRGWVLFNGVLVPVFLAVMPDTDYQWVVSSVPVVNY